MKAPGDTRELLRVYCGIRFLPAARLSDGRIEYIMIVR